MKYVFTITAGRTGTAWLTQLFDLNFECTAVHEYLNFGDIGIRSPDIGIMQAFNHWGNNDRVRNFWQKKLSLLPKTGLYVETNHALTKGGLIENIDFLPADAEVFFVAMRRNWTRQALSYLNRYDFSNFTTVWQWYLDHRYALNIVPSEQLYATGMLGSILWYIIEVETRQAYYRQLYSDRFTFIDSTLEQATTMRGAQELLAPLGHTGSVYMPEKTNVNAAKGSPFTPEQIDAVVAKIAFDAEKMAASFIASGRRLGDRDSVLKWHAAVQQSKSAATH